MKLIKLRFMLVALMLTFSQAASAAALIDIINTILNSLREPPKEYTLYIHGKDHASNGRQGDYDNYDYWGDRKMAKGPNPRMVNYEGTIKITDSNNSIRRALDCFCTGQNWCHIAAHSAGNLQIGYALADYNSTQREIKNATPIPGGGGECYKKEGAGGQTGGVCQFHR